MYEVLIIQSLLNGLVAGAMFALMGVGFTLIFGVIDIPNFAQSEFYMLGAYTTYYLMTLLAIDPLISMVIATCAVFLVGIAFEKAIISRLRMKYEQWLSSSIILTIGVSCILQNTAMVVFGERAKPISYLYKGVVEFAGIVVSIERVIIFFAGIGLITLTWFLLTRTRTGKAMQAVAQDREAAALVGITSARVYSITFGLGAALAAAAGGLLLPLYGVFPTVGGTTLLMMFVVVILGGFGSVHGAIVGGFIMGITGALTTTFIGMAYQNIVAFSLMVTVLLVKPTGIFGVGR